MEKPSRRLDVTTTWEKPFVFSAAMAAFKFWEKCVNVKKSSSPLTLSPYILKRRLNLKSLIIKSIMDKKPAMLGNPAQ